MTRIGLVNENLEELSVGFGVLNREHIRVQSADGVEEVLEFGVAEVGVDLGGVLDISSRELEAVDGPLQVCITLLARAKGETLTKGGFIDLARELLAH